jgi:hypothetical protein
MADFKSIIALMEDNDKSGLFANNIIDIVKKPGRDELTVEVESGWGIKALTGKAVPLVLMIDRDEWDRLHAIADAATPEFIVPSESTSVAEVVQSAEAELEKAKRIIARQLEALKWYADEQNYDQNEKALRPEVLDDHGKRARGAL